MMSPADNFKLIVELFYLSQRIVYDDIIQTIFERIKTINGCMDGLV